MSIALALAGEISKTFAMRFENESYLWRREQAALRPVCMALPESPRFGPGVPSLVRGALVPSPGGVRGNLGVALCRPRLPGR